MKKNKIGKYFKYAIGEIVLVVIGILIALSINNWNTKRLEKNRAESFIMKMRTQVKANIVNTEKNLQKFKSHLKITENLISIIGNEKTIDIDEKIDSLVSVNLYDFHLNLNLNVLVEGKENGDLSIITSDSLRQSIYQLSTYYNTIIERERIANQDLQILFNPYLNKNYNYRNGLFNFWGQNIQQGKSKIYKGDNWKILEDQEFENHIFVRMDYNKDLINSYTELHKILTTTHGLLKI
jgi:hypothetical protein